MQNPELFDPLKIGRYTVIHVWYEYPSQRGEEKYFIVLRHDKASAGFICRCIKATSRIARFENDPDLLKGVVLYEQRTIPFFTERTVVDPDSKLDIDHSHLKDQSRKNRFRVAGKMPEDFHERPSMVTAKPAMRGRLKTGHVKWPKTGVVLPCRSEFGKAGFGRAVTC